VDEVTRVLEGDNYSTEHGAWCRCAEESSFWITPENPTSEYQWHPAAEKQGEEFCDVGEFYIHAPPEEESK